MNISSTSSSTITNLIQQSTQTKKSGLTYNDLTTYSMANSLSTEDYAKYTSLNASSEVSSYTSQLNTLLSSADENASADDAGVLSNIISASTSMYNASGAVAAATAGTQVDIEA